jgi:hypothetical protein
MFASVRPQDRFRFTVKLAVRRPIAQYHREILSRSWQRLTCDRIGVWSGGNKESAGQPEKRRRGPLESNTIAGPPARPKLDDLSHYKSLREIPSLFIIAFRVVRGTPRRAAASLITPPVSRKTCKM